MPFVHVKYEELVHDPETRFREGRKHLGVPSKPKRSPTDLEAVRNAPVPLKRKAPLRDGLERRLLARLGRSIHHNRVGGVLKRVRFALDVVLKE